MNLKMLLQMAEKIQLSMGPDTNQNEPVAKTDLKSWM